MYVYELDRTSLDLWRKLEEIPRPWEVIGDCVKAAHILMNCVPSLAEWEGNGEYWLSPLPMLHREVIVLVRPRANPYAPAYAVSPVDLPSLGKNLLILTSPPHTA